MRGELNQLRGPPGLHRNPVHGRPARGDGLVGAKIRGAAMTAMEPRHAVVCFDGWAGRREASVTVIGETPKRYRVVLNAPLGGNFGGDVGDVRLVPKYAVRFYEEPHDAHRPPRP